MLMALLLYSANINYHLLRQWHIGSKMFPSICQDNQAWNWSVTGLETVDEFQVLNPK